MNKNNAAAVTEPAPQGVVAHAAVTPERTGGANSAALLKQLAAEFPRSQISWRAQTLSKDGNKALALAYIDARDVAKRLDDVVGAANWQNRYTHADKKTVCEIGIKVDGEWVWKANGAGDSDVEAEKGALSDAFKRAATMWGIGRYLYNDEFKNVWAECESSEFNGKKKWSKWVGDPWASVRGANPEAKQKPKPEQKPKLSPAEACAAYMQKIEAANTEAGLRKITDTDNYKRLLEAIDGMPEKECLMALVTKKFEELLP